MSNSVSNETVEQLFDLTGKVALITGAGTGLGRQFAMTLASAGASVVLAARRRDKLEETADSIRAAGGQAICLELDVTDKLSVTNCIRESESETGTPDILINNAGIARQGYLTDIEEQEWDAVLDTNLKGVFMVAQAVAQSMLKAKKPGSIVNVASILGFRNAPSQSRIGEH